MYCYHILSMKPEQNRTTIAEIFLEYQVDQNVRILDLACGVGIVAEDIAKYGYTNVDGLDPVKGYLEAAQAKGIYKVFNL